MPELRKLVPAYGLRAGPFERARDFDSSLASLLTDQREAVPQTFLDLPKGRVQPVDVDRLRRRNQSDQIGKQRNMATLLLMYAHSRNRVRVQVG